MKKLEKERYTMDEAAKLLNRDVRTIKRWVADETIDSFKFGGSRIILKSEIERVYHGRPKEV